MKPGKSPKSQVVSTVPCACDSVINFLYRRFRTIHASLSIEMRIKDENNMVSKLTSNISKYCSLAKNHLRHIFA